MRISKGILSFETLYAARTRGVQASDRNLTRFARSKAFIPSVYKRQYACQRLKSALAASSSSVGASPPSSSSLPAPVLSCWQVRRSFSGADLVAGKADEAVGLSPGNEDNAASCPRCPEKPCCLLYTEGIKGRKHGKGPGGDSGPCRVEGCGGTPRGKTARSRPSGDGTGARRRTGGGKLAALRPGPGGGRRKEGKKQKETAQFSAHSRGKVTWMRVPWPGALVRWMSPWWRATACLTMERPRPVPPEALEWLLSTR